MAEVAVCKAGEIAPGAKRCFTVEGHKVCVARIHSEGGGDEWFAIDDTCSHEDYSLCEGDLWEDELEIECPKHGSTFDLRTGEPQSLPATRPVAVYPVRVDGDDVKVTVP